MATSRDQLYDKRIVERNIEKALLTKEEYDSYLKTLADKADAAESIKFSTDESD